jgi:hypothetical protein
MNVNLIFGTGKQNFYIKWLKTNIFGHEIKYFNYF